jgi:hypothetical protein
MPKKHKRFASHHVPSVGREEALDTRPEGSNAADSHLLWREQLRLTSTLTDVRGLLPYKYMQSLPSDVTG